MCVIALSKYQSDYYFESMQYIDSIIEQENGFNDILEHVLVNDETTKFYEDELITDYSPFTDDFKVCFKFDIIKNALKFVLMFFNYSYF